MNTNDDVARDPARPPVYDGDRPEFEMYRRKVTEIEDDKRRILSIPTWGWTGDGKTTSLLTAVHCLDPLEHGVGLTPPIDTSELASIEADTEPYSTAQMGLTVLAQASSAKLARLRDRFFDRSAWPIGTDEPTAFVLRIRADTRTLGYALVADLPGGNFRKADELAKRVMQDAHGCMILVNPQRFVLTTAEGKLYDEEIQARVQTCVEAGVPVAVLITQTDMYTEPDSLADRAHARMETLARRHGDQAVIRVFRVSAIGFAPDGEQRDAAPTPPPVKERDPAALLEAWVWLLCEALTPPASEIRKKVPNPQLRQLAVGGTAVRQGAALLELRARGTYSDAPGQPICWTDDAVPQRGFLFVEKSGQIVIADTSIGVGERPATSSLGRVEPNPGLLDDHQVEALEGTLFMGARRGADAIWRGPFTDLVQRASLPASILSWSAINADTVVGLDAQGRLHLFTFSGGNWVQKSFVDEFCQPGENIVCRALTGRQTVMVVDDEQVQTVAIEEGGEFGARRTVSTGSFALTERCFVGRTGLVVAVNEDGTLTACYGESVARVRDAREESLGLTLGAHGPTFAFIDSHHRLRVCLFSKGKFRVTAAKLSPVVGEGHRAMAWGDGDRVLVASQSDGEWSLYETMGTA